MNRSKLVLILFIFISIRLSSQVWVVPVENGTKLSPFTFSDSTKMVGGNLFNTNCKSCHGDPGKNNAVKLVPLPPDPASVQMQTNTDGELFYKVSEGRGTMPSFKNTISSSDTWRIISFIRSYNEKYVQEIARKLDPGASYQQVKMQIAWLKERNQVQVTISALKNGIRQQIPGAEVKLFVKRYFGNLLVDEPHNTDNQGIAQFNFPKNLPGDSIGFISLSAKPTDETIFGEAKADTTLAIGVPTYRPPLNEPRAMWNVVQKTPIWLLLTYTLSVLAVWGFIVYVLLQLKTIYKSGSKRTTLNL